MLARAFRRAAHLCLLAFLCAVVLAHVALLPMAKWSSDEYFIFWVSRQGLPAFLDRLEHWSPRPFSEAVLHLYATAVAAFHRPGIIIFMAVLWFLVVAAPLTAAWLVGGRARTRGPLFTAAMLLATFLLIATPGDAFYWPAAAVAYLPTLAALLFVCVLCGLSGNWSALHERPVGQRTLLLIVPLLGASSSEIGAAFALCLAALSLGAFALTSRAAIAATWWVWLPPAALAAIIMMAFALYRGQGSDLMAPTSSTMHHFGPSLLPAFAHVFREFWGFRDFHHVADLPIKLALLFGFRPIAEASRRWSAADLVIPGALLGAAFASVFYAYYGFGTLCCERHETVRQCLYILAVFSFACMIPLGRNAGASTRALRAGLLAAPLLALSVTRVPKLIHDYQEIGATLAAKAATWKSGTSAGSVMKYYMAPLPQVANYGRALTPGEFHLPASGNSETSYLLRYFGKSEVHAALPPP